MQVLPLEYEVCAQQEREAEEKKKGRKVSRSRPDTGLHSPQNLRTGIILLALLIPESEVCSLTHCSLTLFISLFLMLSETSVFTQSSSL